MITLVCAAVGAVTGLGVANLGVPAALAALGFTEGGIAAGSTAAAMMSSAAVANGGGVAAGGLVAFLQSVGAAGLSGAAQAATSAVGAVIGALL
ncbi:interferon alpha-inducible protein 27-like protein 2A [Dromaius novaehollandiae]|uniref:interferon alpha-inducible protein 27-like protein 2A n=1 Tax=Dromaius novaehollandiae TaxID=8790 RepID=UPI00311E5C91